MYSLLTKSLSIRSESISSPTSRSASSPSGGDMKRNQDNAELSSPASKRILLSDDDGSNMHSVRIRQQVNTRGESTMI